MADSTASDPKSMITMEGIEAKLFGDAIGELGVEWVNESRVDIYWTCSTSTTVLTIRG